MKDFTEPPQTLVNHRRHKKKLSTDVFDVAVRRTLIEFASRDKFLHIWESAGFSSVDKSSFSLKPGSCYIERK